MGKLLSGIMGPVKGRVGNLVFTTWKGKNVVKSRPERKAEITENEKITKIIKLAKEGNVYATLFLNELK